MLRVYQTILYSTAYIYICIYSTLFYTVFLYGSLIPFYAIIIRERRKKEKIIQFGLNGAENGAVFCVTNFVSSSFPPHSFLWFAMLNILDELILYSIPLLCNLLYKSFWIIITTILSN